MIFYLCCGVVVCCALAQETTTKLQFINKFNNKEGSDQIKLILNKNNKDKGGCNASFYTNNIKNHILNIISLILIVCMIYYFIIGLINASNSRNSLRG